MSKNIDQVFTANPITSNAGTDLMYFGQSPYGVGNDAAMLFSNFKAQFLAAASIAPGTTNQLAYYAGAGSSLSPLTLGSAFTVAGSSLVLANLPASTLLGNNTGGSAAPGNVAFSVFLQAANNLSDLANISVAFGNISPLTTKGDLLAFSTVNARLAVGATNGQVLQVLSSAATGLAYSTATYPATTTINQVLYSSAANVIGGVTAVNSAVMISSAGGVPSFSTTLPSGLTIPGYQTSISLPLSLGNGGTGVALTASNGGIVYSNASTLAILAGTATAGQMLQSGASTTPTWSTTTYPATNAVSTLLYASSANVMGALATANNATLVTSATGVPSLAAPAQGLVVTSSVLTVGAANNIPFNNNKGIQDSNGNLLLQFTLQASAVNYWNLQNAATTNSVILQTEGSDTNVNAIYATKGTGNSTFFCNGSSGNELLSIVGSTNPVNFFTLTAAATTVSPIMAVGGSDTNIPFTINGKGTGGVVIQGTSIASAGNAAAGYVGEFISSVIAQASAVTQTSNAASNVTSIALTAGDWDVWGNVTAVTVGTTNNIFAAWVSSSSASAPDFSLRSAVSGTALGSGVGVTVPPLRFNVGSGGLTVFLSSFLGNASGNGTVCGGIYARRRR